jgi:hypothetical protein
MADMRADATTTSWRRRLPLLMPVLILAVLLSGAVDAHAITREAVLWRAQSWVDVPVPYSQAKYYHGYRTDCSGFASMSWQTGTSWTTWTLGGISSKVATAALKPGDIMLNAHSHVRLFYGWADKAHTRYVAYEQTGPGTKSSIKTLASDWDFGYRPYRYRSITDGPRPWNLIANPTFDVWASAWPVWWEAPASQPATEVVRRTDVTKSGKSALGLVDRSSRPRDLTEVSQTASVTAGLPYALSVWARTDSDPAGLKLRLEFRDAAGNVLSAATTDGGAWGVGSAALKQMSLTSTAPPDAVAATIRVRLAGGIDASGGVGTTAVLDDFRFYDSSPVTSAVTISRTSVRSGGVMALRGSVIAPITEGSVRIYVIRPGRTTASVFAVKPLAGGAWSMTFRPTVRGRYTFSARYLGYGPYGPVSSAPVRLLVR